RRVERLRAEVGALREPPTMNWPNKGSLHDEATTVPPSGETVTAETSPHPTAIGKYLIAGLIDAGGQALVYRAVHPNLPRGLAIKLARQRSWLGCSQLKGAAAILCALEHPNLVRVYDLDIHEGRPFVAMEYVRGQNLHQVARQASPTARQAASWVAAVARAL